jgi:hypothetical protein
MKSQNFEDEQHSGFDALKQLRGIYSDKEVINLLNTVSENKRKPFQTTLNHDTMIYYNNKSASAKLQTEVRLQRIPDRIHPVL